ncbi:hypothetical protein [Pantoea cypripedii]|uniref:Uncharacterized protein n=1 Tax=Pantoea cypripedii TaxID=55209 RepID=A0A6B9FVF1_PANCY|nr:hypothetical protein [Pantoea cypripedii]QGY27904.1 hypothetical protein CUN67_02715 [Pantoea cypripedii]
MTIAQSSKSVRTFILFLVIYLICLAVVFFVHPVWGVIEKLSYRLDDVLNATGMALADGELDPAGLWVIFGIPFIVAALIFVLIRRAIHHR